MLVRLREQHVENAVERIGFGSNTGAAGTAASSSSTACQYSSKSDGRLTLGWKTSDIRILLRMQMVGEERVDDRGVPEGAGVVHAVVVGIELLVRRADRPEEGVAGLGRADVVLEADVDNDRAGDPRREVDAVE